MNRFRSLVLSLSTGYVLMFFSEHLFWARVRPEDSLGGWAATWLAYSLLAFIFLSAVRYFRVRCLEALFVAGALVGWLGEGVLVQTLYDAFPLQISWTGLAWHSLISVCIGWYGLRRALAARIGRGMCWCLGLGAFWGLWGIFWRVEEPNAQASVPAFAAFAFVTTAIMGVSLWVYEQANPRAFDPSRPSLVAASGVLLLIFGLGTVPVAPISIVLLPVLVALVLVALARNRACETEDDVLLSLPGSRALRPMAFLALAIIPSAATLIYAAASAFDLRWHTNWVVYLVTTPAGFLLFGAAWIRLMRRKPACP